MATATTSAPANPIIIPSQRNAYQALTWPTIPPESRSRHAKHLAELVKFARSFARFESGRGPNNWEAGNVDPYSISLSHEAILYQYRHSWGSKYGPQIRKQYFIVRWAKDAANHAIEEEIPAARARAAVRAFPDDPAGAVEYLLGLRPKLPAQSITLMGFKLVRVRYDHATGRPRFYSFYDGITEYEIGRITQDIAHPDHAGGLYMYLSAEMCDPARIATKVPPSAPADDLAVLRVVGTGRRIRYPESGKYAVSRLTPIALEKVLSR